MRRFIKRFWWILKRWVMRQVNIDPETQDLREFRELILGQTNPETPVHGTLESMLKRIEHLREEVNELERAARLQDLEDIADSLVDLVYVAKNLSVGLGLPWEYLWDEVHRQNMKKEGARSERLSRDAKKPRHWHGPAIAHILAQFGYVRERWITRDPAVPVSAVDEKRCIDVDA